MKLQQKDQNHISHCWQTRSQVGAKGAVIHQFWTVNIQYIEQNLLWKRETNYSFHQAVDSQYFAKVSALEL